MTDLKTVEDSDCSRIQNPLLTFQKEGVERMRTSLLSCTLENSNDAKAAIQQVTVLRIYHQISRIIRYLDLMDKLEDKLYESIEYTIDTSPAGNPSTWFQLLRIQEILQKNMIESHKLLQPYMDLTDFTIPELVNSQRSADPETMLIPSESRDKLRTSAQAILVELEAGDLV